jgi:hypothetical protein
MRGRARAAATRALADVGVVFGTCGFERLDEHAEVLELRRADQRLRARLRPNGRVFGGNFALEVETADAQLPPTAGLTGGGRGVVRLDRVAFRSRRGDAAGMRLAGKLESDEALQAALRKVHFEAVRVEPDGRPVIRHLGGSVVWVLFPPLVRTVPLVPEQAEAVARALAAFTAAASGDRG